MRNDKTCLNCRYVVENRFCLIVDKNTDTRKTFHHLLFIFLNLTLRKCFWRTIKILIQTSCTPKNTSQEKIVLFSSVRLYIFIGFIPFYSCYFKCRKSYKKSYQTKKKLNQKRSFKTINIQKKKKILKNQD
jgi:hypothetical protein